jgi:hypothetical protein
VPIDEFSHPSPESDSAAPHSEAGDAQAASQERAASSGELPLNLHSLLVARTPLVEGVDYMPAAPNLNRSSIERPIAEPPLPEKARVDTLSPLESVPPPAAYMAEAPPARPSVVPPVRSPYADPQAAYAYTDAISPRLRSDPPPRIPLSDRPPRCASHSDPPPRVSRSDPPPRTPGDDLLPSSSRAYGAQRRPSWNGEDNVESLDAQRRMAATVPAEARMPQRAAEYDPSVPLPPLRTPSFPADQLTATIRHHENSRLRNVAVTMMFVICIVTGAITGMRWYVERSDETPEAHDESASIAPRIQKVRLDRAQPNAVVSPHPIAPTVETVPAEVRAAAPSPAEPEKVAPIAKLPAEPEKVAPIAKPQVVRQLDPTNVQSPWASNVAINPGQKGNTTGVTRPKPQAAEATPSTDGHTVKPATKPSHQLESPAPNRKKPDLVTPLI